jgi:hypothetical protein
MAIPRVLVPQPDGSLLPDLPQEYQLTKAPAHEARPLADVKTQTLRGIWQLEDDALRVDTPEGVALRSLAVPADFMLSAELELHGPACEAGFLVRMAPQGDAGRKVALEMAPARLAVYQWNSWGDPEPALTRPLRLRDATPLQVHLVCHGSILEVFVSGQASLATRLYQPTEGWLGLWAANGTAQFRHLRLAALPPLV